MFGDRRKKLLSYNYFLYHTISTFNPLLHRYSFLPINNRQLLKTLWEKKKLLVMSNFSFSHNVFYSIRYLYPHLSIFLTLYLYLLLCGKELTLHQTPKFYPSPYSSVDSVEVLRVVGSNLQHGQYSLRELMTVTATGFIPLSSLSILSTMAMCKSRQWLGKNTAWWTV